MKQTVCLVVVSMFASLLMSVGAQAQPVVKGAYIAQELEIYRTSGGQVLNEKFGEPVLIVTLDHWVEVSAVALGNAIIVNDLTSGMPVLVELVDTPGAMYPHPTNPKDGIAASFYLKGSKNKLSAANEYDCVVTYDGLRTWDEALDGGGTPTGITLVTVSEPLRLEVKKLPEGKEIDSYGNEVDPSGTPKYGGQGHAPGLRGILDKAKLKLTPETGDNDSQIGLKYDLTYLVDAHGFSRKWPGRFSVDLAVDGRATTDKPDLALAGYAKGDANVRVMMLPGSSRYYPIGLRGAIGYEGDEDFTKTAFTASGQLVVSVPYIDRILIAWHRALGVNRAFAPAFVSAAVVYSDGGSIPVEQSRGEYEAGWNLPIAERWDLNLSWRYYDFFKAGLHDENLFASTLTFYTTGDFSQGVTMSLEDGFRPVVGDIGSTLLLGYLVKPF